MEFFVLQSKRKMEKTDNSHGIIGLKNSLGMPLDPSGVTTATPASIEHGVLEWIIPNNQFNQNQISQYYSQDYTILAAGTERKHGNVEKMANMPEPLDAKESIIKPLVADPILTTPVAPVADSLSAAESQAEAIMKARKLLADVDSVEEEVVVSPDAPTPEPKVRATNKITLLKEELNKKLTFRGVKIPKNASLPTLEKLLEVELNKA